MQNEKLKLERMIDLARLRTVDAIVEMSVAVLSAGCSKEELLSSKRKVSENFKSLVEAKRKAFLRA